MNSELSRTHVAILFIIVTTLITAMGDGGQSRNNAWSKEKVFIATEDDFRLAGMLYKAKGTKTPAILLIHQCDIDRLGNETGFEKLADTLSRLGMTTLLYFQRGYGESVDVDISKMENAAIMEKYNKFHGGDANRVWQYLLSLEGVDSARVAIGGASCGGRISIRTASKNRNAKAIVLLSASMGAPVLDLIHSVKSPLLSVAAQHDQYAYISTTTAFEFSQSEESKLIVVKGSDHGLPILNKHPFVEGEIVNFLQNALSN